MDDAQDMSAPQAASSSVWNRLKAAREANGFSMAELASRTRVTQRFLEALEAGRPNDLPSPTYASGFAKAYARAVGLDEVAVGRDVREEIARHGAPVRQYSIQEIADPARGPSRGLVILTAGLALAVLILAVLWLATGMFRGTGEVASTPDTTTPTVAAAPAAAPTPTGGPVVLTASDQVWMRVYDAGGKRLFEGTLNAGDHFDVPGDAADPMINIGRPDKLAISVNGQPVAPLGDGKRALKDVKISAAALLARGSQPTTQGPTSQPTTAPSPLSSSTARRAPSIEPTRAAPRPSPSSSPRRTSGTTTPNATVPPAAKAASLPAATVPAPTATPGAQ